MSMAWLLTPPVFFGLAGACLALLGLTLFLLLRIRRMHRAMLGMAREMSAREEHAEEAVPEPIPLVPGEKQSPGGAVGFDGVLKAEELRSRLDRHVPSGEPLERYMHVRNLAEKGCETGEIARILHISPDEVSQVLALSRIRSRSG